MTTHQWIDNIAQYHVSHGKEAEKVVDVVITVVLFYGTCYFLGEIFYGS